jgi:hypothetical protein
MQMILPEECFCNCIQLRQAYQVQWELIPLPSAWFEEGDGLGSHDSEMAGSDESIQEFSVSDMAGTHSQ